MSLIPGWVISLPWDLIQAAAKEFRLDPRLVGAIVMTESGGKHQVTRYEPGWKYFHGPRIHAENLGITEQTESIHQATSYGAMQVMGAVARELGFVGHLPTLIDPKLGLYYGCRKLRDLWVKYPEEEDAIAAYNAGSPRKTPGGQYVNMVYVDKVSGYLRELRKLV